MKTKKEKIAYLLNASNRHEAVLNDMRNEIDRMHKTLEAVAYKHLIEDFEQAKLSKAKQPENKDLESGSDIDVVSKIEQWCEENYYEVQYRGEYVEMVEYRQLVAFIDKELK